MEPIFKTLVLFSDTDSLIYKNESQVLYENLRENNQVYPQFDFSNYNEDDQLLSKHQKPANLKLKDEGSGKIIHSNLALMSKSFSITMADQQKVLKETINTQKRVYSTLYSPEFSQKILY